MGLAANQGRLLTLTSRINDLELRSMHLSSQKMLMAMQSSALATKYSNDLQAADEMKPTEVTNSATKTLVTNYQNLKSKGYDIKLNSEKYPTVQKIIGYNKIEQEVTVDGSSDRTPVSDVLLDTKGTFKFNVFKAPNAQFNTYQDHTALTVNTINGVQNAPKTPNELEAFLRTAGVIGDALEVSESDTIVKAIVAFPMGDKTIQAGETFSLRDLSEYLQASAIGELREDRDGNPTKWDRDTELIGGYGYERLCKIVDPDVNVNLTPVQTTQTILVDDPDSPIYGEVPNEEGAQLWNDIQSNPAALVNAWTEGNIIISYGGKNINYNDFEGLTETVATTTSLDYSEINKARDKAQREYEDASKKLSAKEKIIDMELRQVDTQYQACTTEYDSVKSLIEKNADKSFNIFS